MGRSVANTAMASIIFCGAAASNSDGFGRPPFGKAVTVPTTNSRDEVAGRHFSRPTRDHLL